MSGIEPDTCLKNVLELAGRRLAEAGCDTPALDAEVLLAHTLDRDRAWLYMHLLAALDQAHLDRFADLLGRRERREPVAYLTGHKAFFGLEFEVNRHVLIPRPETELLVETAIELANLPKPKTQNRGPETENPNSKIRNPKSKIQNLKSKIVIADVGTGSGCIAIALARNLPQASLLAIDISNEALALARRNAARYELTNRVAFLVGNLLQPLARPVDFIVSNPPYVSRLELTGPAVSPEVSRYEPRLALDGGPDGLEVIRQLLAQARSKLKPGGSLLVEIGAGQGQAAAQLAQAHFPTARVAVKKDLAGLDRLLVVSPPPLLVKGLALC